MAPSLIQKMALNPPMIKPKYYLRYDMTHLDTMQYVLNEYALYIAMACRDAPNNIYLGIHENPRDAAWLIITMEYELHGRGQQFRQQVTFDLLRERVEHVLTGTEYLIAPVRDHLKYMFDFVRTSAMLRRVDQGDDHVLNMTEAFKKSAHQQWRTQRKLYPVFLTPDAKHIKPSFERL